MQSRARAYIEVITTVSFCQIWRENANIQSIFSFWVFDRNFGDHLRIAALVDLPREMLRLCSK